MPAMTADRARARLPRAALRPMWLTLVGAAWSAVLFATGCWNFTINHRQAAARPILPPLVKPKDALTLEVWFIERGQDDPLLGRALWSELDETAVKSPETRARLRAAGLRVGLAGSHPPPALRAAAGNQRAASAAKGFHPVTLLAGSETNIEAAVIPEEFQLRIKGKEEDVVRTYQGARCVFRMSGERVQDGWVRLHIQPELHHGPETIQPSAGGGEWTLQQGQKIDRLYEQSFDVELNLGELVVVGAHEGDTDMLGARFFRSGAPPAASERVLVIRVADVQQIEPVRSNEY